MRFYNSVVSVKIVQMTIFPAIWRYLTLSEKIVIESNESVCELLLYDLAIQAYLTSHFTWTIVTIWSAKLLLILLLMYNIL